MKIFCLILLFIIISYVSSQGTWSNRNVNNLAGQPQLRYEHSAVPTNIVEGIADPRQEPSFFIFGGRTEIERSGVVSDTTPLNDHRRYGTENEDLESFPSSNGPPPLAGHSATTDLSTSSYFLFGGVLPNLTLSSALYRFDFPATTWTLLFSTSNNMTVGPSARNLHASVMYRNEVYVYGGRDEGGAPLDDLWAYSVSEGTWREVGSVGERPRARFGHACTSNGTVILCFGGFTDQLRFSNETWVFNGTNWIQIEIRDFTPEEAQQLGLEDLNNEIPSPRIGHTLVSTFNGRSLILFGGLDGNYQNDLFYFDTLCQRWLRLIPDGNTPSPRAEHSAVVVVEDNAGDTQMFIYGGRDEQQVFDQVYRYTVPTPPPQCDSINSENSSGAILIFSGFFFTSLLCLFF